MASQPLGALIMDPSHDQTSTVLTAMAVSSTRLSSWRTEPAPEDPLAVEWHNVVRASSYQ
jgi:hypothetical protein